MMSLRKIILCLFSANLVVSEFASPELLADYDLNTSLQPLEISWQGWESPDDLHLIHGLLVSRSASPLKDDLQKRDSSDLHLIRGLLRTRSAQPEVLADYGIGTPLRPPKDSLLGEDSLEDRHVIRGLLRVRQQCPTGYGQCSNAPGRSVSLLRLPLSLFHSSVAVPLPNALLLWLPLCCMTNHRRVWCV